MNSFLRRGFYGILLAGLLMAFAGCTSKGSNKTVSAKDRIKPFVVTEKTANDTDDPAIWIHPKDPSKSLILGTDKAENGALYVFDLEGKIVEEKVVRNIHRPNNVDIEYGFAVGDSSLDIAVVTERGKSQLRVFRLPDMQAIDGGGLPVFEGEAKGYFRAPMGIALYKNPDTEEIFAIVSRKDGPSEGYLWQYLLKANANGEVALEFVRRFGRFSGKKEIEAIAVDDALGWVYYSDETVGVRQYHADPSKGNEELLLFAQEGFVDDQEGISIYPTSDSAGYLLVSDQQANEFHVYDRQNPGAGLLTVLPLSTEASDGSELTAKALMPDFAKGLFVAMSDDRTFQLYRWEDLEERIFPK